jgi:Zn-dependent protease
MALLCSVIVIIIHTVNLWAAPEAESFLFQTLDILFSMFSYGIFLNVALAIFNLLPIPPLDGSHIFANLLPEEAAFRFRQLGFFGIFIILALFYYVPGFSKVFLNIIALFTLPYLKFIGIFIPEFSRIYLS